MNPIIKESRVRYGSRGDGSLFLRKGSANWLYQYFWKGTLHEESTGTTDLKKARKFVKDRREKSAADRQGLRRYVPASQQKVTVSQLLDSLEADYRIRQRKSMAQILSHMKPIRELFGFMRASDLTGRLVDSYIHERLAA